jgi:hypothetical protein
MISKKSAKINLGGKERTFYFGLGFLGMFIENTESTLETLEDDIKKNPFKVLPELMYYSLKYGYLRNEIEPDFNKYDVSDWIDDLGGVESKAVTDFMDGLGASMTSGLPEEKGVKKR